MSPQQDTVAKILAKILDKKQVSEDDKTYVLEALNQTPYLIKEIKFYPDSFMKLIEQDKQFACELFINISRTELFEEYISVFLTNPITASSMEGLNMIIQHVDIPQELIHVYIRSMFKHTRTVGVKTNKNRIARLIAAFIYTLIDHGHLDVKGVDKDVKF